MANIIVLGGSGFIGKSLIDRLEKTPTRHNFNRRVFLNNKNFKMGSKFKKKSKFYSKTKKNNFGNKKSVNY